MKVKADPNDIYKYVKGFSSWDALEMSIEPVEKRVRYEFMDEFIYHAQSKSIFPQSEKYKEYMEWVSGLKSKAPDMQDEEIFRLCEEIAEVAPEEINLELTEEDLL